MFKNPASRDIVRDIQSLLEFEAHTMILNGGNPSFANVYNSLRKQGIEVDIQTATYVYENAFAPLNSGYFTSPQQLEEYRGATFKKIFEKQTAVIRRNEIGKDNPVVAAVAAMAKTVQEDLKHKPSVQKIMQEKLKKAAARVLELKGKSKPKGSAWQALEDAMMLDRDGNQFFMVGGDAVLGGQTGRAYLANADMVWTEFQKEMNEVANEMEAMDSLGAAEMRNYADILTESAYDLLMSSREVKDVIVASLAEAGLTRMAKINGQDKLVIDWRKITSTLDFEGTITGVLDRQGYTPAEIAKIAPFLEREFDSMMREKAARSLASIAGARKASDIDRLSRIAVLGGFKQAEKQMVYEVMGIDEMTQENLNAIEGLMLTYDQFMKMDMAELSPTFFATIERHIRNLIERTQEGQSIGLKLSRRYQLMSQFSSASLLLNVGNAIVENTTSGLAEMINTAVVNPAWVLKGFNAWSNTFMDVIQGGVRQGSEKSNINDQRVNVDDRTGWEQADTLQKKFFSIANIFSRVALTATDASAKSFLWKSMEINAIRLVLEGQGLTTGEAHAVINETYFGNRDQLEMVAKEMERKLGEAGINTAKGKWKRMAGELALANLMTDGTVMQDALASLEAENKLRKGVKDKLHIDRDMLLALRKAASNAAARGLGHSTDTLAMSLLDRTIEFGNKKAGKAKTLGRRAAWEMGLATVGNIFRFRSGMLKWMALNIQKSSGISLVITLLHDVWYDKQHLLLKKENIAKRLAEVERSKGDMRTYDNAMSEFTQDFEKALAFRQRLTRSTLQPGISFVLWKFVIAPAVENLFKEICSENTTECLQKKIIYMKKRGWDNWINKLMPIAVQDYVNTLVLHRPSPGNYYNFKKNKNAFNGMMESYLGTFQPLNQKSQDRAIANILNNAGEDPVYGLLDDIKNAVKYKDAQERIDVIGGKFVGRTLNLGGPLKMYDINKRYFNALQGKSNVESNATYKKYKPDTFLEAMILENMTKDLYREYVNNKTW